MSIQCCIIDHKGLLAPQSSKINKLRWACIKFLALGLTFMYMYSFLVVWWMRPIYKLFFATPCKHPNFWGESGERYTIYLTDQPSKFSKSYTKHDFLN